MESFWKLSFSFCFSFLYGGVLQFHYAKCPEVVSTFLFRSGGFGGFGGLGMTGMTGMWWMVVGEKPTYIFLVACPVCFLRWGGIFNESVFVFKPEKFWIIHDPI